MVLSHRSVQYLSSSPDETEVIGKEIARRKHQDGTIVCLTGDLGSGKTTLSKGFISTITGMASCDINSPTFNYLNIYEGSQILCHFDCYLLKNGDDFLKRGFDEYFGKLCLIEWPEKIEKILPKKRIVIIIEYDGEDKRRIFYEER